MRSSAASDVYKRQDLDVVCRGWLGGRIVLSFFVKAGSLPRCYGGQICNLDTDSDWLAHDNSIIEYADFLEASGGGNGIDWACSGELISHSTSIANPSDEEVSNKLCEIETDALEKNEMLETAASNLDLGVNDNSATVVNQEEYESACETALGQYT